MTKVKLTKLNIYLFNVIQIYSGITSGKVLDGELLYTKILEVNLFAFAYRLFHEDFLSNLRGSYSINRCLYTKMLSTISA